MSVQLHPDIETLDKESLCYSIYAQLYHNFFNAQQKKDDEHPYGIEEGDETSLRLKNTAYGFASAIAGAVTGEGGSGSGGLLLDYLKKSGGDMTGKLSANYGFEAGIGNTRILETYSQDITDPEGVVTAIDTLFRRAATGQEMLYHFIGLSDKYLYEPNSPMHDEELHILVLRALLDNPCLSDTDKIRPRYLLEIAMKNRPGDVAADFTVTCRDGRRRQLSGIKADYVLVYFNDPDCEDCRRVKELLSLSPVVNGLLESGRLKLLSVCVEGKTPAWEKADFLKSWIDGYDEGQRLTREQVYDLKAIPALYLLDAEKRVILKDASFKQVEERLS